MGDRREEGVVFEDIHRMADQQAQGQQETARRIREDAVKNRMRRWGIGREPAEHMLDLELRIQELESKADR